MKYLIALLFCFTLAAQQTVNNFTVKTNLTVGGSINGVSSNLLSKISSGSFAAGSIFPLPQGVVNYWAIGDSQTYGAYATPQAYADYDPSTGIYRLFQDLRYPNIIASKFGLNLSNQAVSGQAFSYLPTNPINGLSQMRVLGVNNSGLVTCALGYNDGYSYQFGQEAELSQAFRRAANAIIGRALAYTYTTPNGTKYGNTPDTSFSTTSSTIVDDGNAGKSPFPVTYNDSSTITRLILSGSQTVTFSATNPIVWVSLTSSPGRVDLYSGTNMIDSVYSTGSYGYNLPVALIGHGLSGTFTVKNITGSSNSVYAVGGIADSSAAQNKYVVMCAPTVLNGNPVKSRLVSIGRSIRSAVSDWQSYQVYFADFASKVPSTSTPADDVNHPDPSGNRIMANAIINAIKPDVSVDAGSPPVSFSDYGFSVYGDKSLSNQYVTNTAAHLFTSSDKSYIKSYNYGGSSYKPLMLDARYVSSSRGPLSAQGQVSSLSDYPTGNSASFMISGGSAYYDNLYSDGVSYNFIPLTIRSKYSVFSEGPIQVTSIYSSPTNLASGNSVVISNAGITSYIESVNVSGSTKTYNTLELYGKSVNIGVGSGGLTVQGNFSSVSQYPSGNFTSLAMSGGTGYLDSLNNTAGTTSFLPLVIRSSSASFESPVQLTQLGHGFKVKEGSNAKMGTATLTAGSATVSTTAVAVNSRIYLTSNIDGGTPGWLRVSARTAGTSFTITSSSATDTSTVAWIIFDPAP
jgi:hypothetical protein